MAKESNDIYTDENPITEKEEVTNGNAISNSTSHVEKIETDNNQAITAVTTAEKSEKTEAVTGGAITIGADSRSNMKYIGDGFEAELCIDSQWDIAFTGRIVVRNTGDTALHNWTLEFDLDNEITNIWNATFVSRGNGIYSIKNAGWNQDIPLGHAVEFGFIAQGDGIAFPTYYKMSLSNSQRVELGTEEYNVNFNINSDWGSGFSADIEINNNSDTVIEDWVLEFDFDKEISNIWNAIIEEHNGNHYVIKNGSYNQNIAPGATLSFGFNGRDGNVKTEPHNYQLSQTKSSYDHDYDAPTIPMNIQVTTITNESAEITWDASTDNVGVAGYIIYRNNIELGISVEPLFIDTTLEHGKEYRYIVKAFDKSNNSSDESEPLFVSLEEERDTEAPTIPMDVKANAVSGSAIILAWDASSDNVGVVGYHIYKDEEMIATTTVVGYIDTLVDQGKGYTYYVKAYDEANNISNPSELVYITLEDINAPTAPENVKVTIVTGSDITLSWEVSIDNIDVVSYDIYMNGELITSVDRFSTIFTVTGLEPVTEYTFYIRARDKAGNISSISDTVSVKTILEVPIFLEPLITYNKIVLSWSDVIGAEGYELKINDDVIKVSHGTSYVHTDLLPDYRYEYRVRSTKGESKSAWSDSLEIKTDPLYDDWVIKGDIQLEEDMEVGNLTVKGRLSLNGFQLIAHGDVICDGNIDFDKGSLICKGNFNINTSSESYMEMSHGEDYLLVEGDFIQNGIYEGFVTGNQYWFFEGLEYKNKKVTLTDGLIELKGNFRLESAGMLISSNEHRMLFSGDRSQFIDIKGLLCHFANLEYKNTSDQGVSANKYPSAGRVKDNGCKIELTSEYQGITLYEDMIIDGDFYLDGGVLDLNGYKLSIGGNFIHTAGEVHMNGGYLYIQNNYCMTKFTANNNEVVCVEGSGLLIMNKAEDHIEINGSFMMDSNQWNKDYLVEGIISVHDGISRAAEKVLTPFESSKNHTFILLNDYSYSISFLGYEKRVNQDVMYTFSNLETTDVFVHAPIRITNSMKVGRCFGELHLDGNVKQLTDMKMFFCSRSDRQNLGGLFIDKGVLDLGNFALSLYCKFEGNGKLNVNEGTLNYYGYSDYYIPGDIKIKIDFDIDVNNGVLNSYYPTDIKGNINVSQGEIYIPCPVNLYGNINLNQGKMDIYGDLEQYGDIDLGQGIVYIPCPVNIYGNMDVNQGEIFIPSDVYVYGDLNINQGTFICYGRVVIIKDYHLNKPGGTYAPTGNYSYGSTDLEVNYLNESINFTRYYNSQVSDENSVFGKGWSFNFESRITDYSDFIKSVKLPDGSNELLNCLYERYTTYTSSTSRNIMEKYPDNTYILTTNNQIKYAFNAEGLLTWIENQEGNRLILSYGSNGKPESIIDYVGRTYTFTYKDNLLTSITDQLQRTVNYEYNNGQLMKVIDPEGIETYYGYDKEGHLSSIRDNNKNRIETIYYKIEEGVTKVDYVIDKYENKKTYTYTKISPYDETDGKTIITDGNDRTSTQWYDEVYNITYSTDAEGKTVEVEYDNPNKVGEIKSVTDRNGNKTAYIRDKKGNITQVINPDDSYKLYAYDSKNNVISERDEVGKYTYYIYDITGSYLTKVVQPLNGTDLYTDASEDDLFAITRYSYYAPDEAGIVIRGLVKNITDPEGNVTSYTYDSYGNISTVTDGNQNTSTYTYNSIGLLSESRSPKGERTKYTYDNNGNLLTKTTAGDEISSIFYDELGRKRQEITPNQYKTSPIGDEGYRYTYYNNGLTHRVTDPDNFTTAYTYDLYGNVLTETRPNGSILNYEYDLLDRVLWVYFQDSETVSKVLLKSYTYATLSDKKTQKTETIYLSASDTATTVYTYTYATLSDKKTQKTETIYLSASDTATTVYTYDYANRLVRQTNPDGGVITTAYNGNGTVSSSMDPMGKTTYYQYDGLNRLKSQWTPFGNSRYTYTTLTYDKNGNKTTESIGVESVANGSIPSTLLATSYEYDSNNRVVSVTDATGAITTYEYDANGNIAKEKVFIHGSITKETEYEYNHLGKVVGMGQHVEKGDIYGNSMGSTADDLLKTTYTYDANGNVLTMTTADGTTTTYKYDKLDRPVTKAVQGLDEYGNPTAITTSTTYDYAGNVTSGTDANGNTTYSTYDARGQVSKMIDPAGGVTTYYYDNAGRLVATVAPGSFIKGAVLEEMNRVAYTYDVMGRVLLEQDFYYDEAEAQWNRIYTKAYHYDRNGNIIKELDALGMESGSGSTLSERIASGYGTQYTYNDAGLRLTTLTPVSKDNRIIYDISNVYDATGRLITETNARGVVMTYGYDNAGRVIKTSVKDNATGIMKVRQELTYDNIGNVLTQTDGNGNTTSYSYNRLGLLQSMTTPGDSTISSNRIEYQVDLLGRQVYQKDSMGKEISTVYNQNGQVLSQTQQEEDKSQAINVSSGFDKNGNLRFTTDANGVITEHEYDSLNRVTRTSLVVSGKEQATTYTYDQNGNQLTVTDWLGNTYTNIYDELNRLVEKTDPNGLVIEEHKYNNNHAQIMGRDALGNQTIYTYDKNNRLLSTTDPERNVSSQTYDNVGNMATSSDGKGNITTYGYDYLNRLTTVTSAKGETTSYTYDSNGNMITKKDGSNKLIIYTFNAANLLQSETDAGGRVDSYSYYASGKLKTRKDKGNKVTNYIYDIHGNLICETIEDSTISYTYDANGNLLTMTDITGTTSRTYDEQGRVLTKTVPGVGTISYEYDIITDTPSGTHKEKSTDPYGNITIKGCDKVGRLSEVSTGDDTIIYTYYDNGNRESVTYTDGTKEVYTYNKNNTVETLMNLNPDGSILDSYRYTYDTAGNQLTKHEYINGNEKGTTVYTYDVLNRLETVTEPIGRVTSYTYDKSGNRSTETIVQDGVTTVNTYTYDNSLKLLTDVTTKVNNVITERTGYSYDNNGNQLTKRVKTYVENVEVSVVTEMTNTYDLRNQLIRTQTWGTEDNNGRIIENTYNAEGYRVIKEVNGEATYYLYEADKVILEVNKDGKQKARNVYGTNLLIRDVEGETYSYLYNAHGDVTALIASNGTIAATYYYDAFGNILEGTGDVENSILYSGYQYDEETGLYYLNARMYDPKIARFLQEDTYKGDPNDPLSLNLYTYCANNPIIYIDPSGFHWQKGDENLNDDAIFRIMALTNAYYDATNQGVKDKIDLATDAIRNDPSSIIKKDTLVGLPDMTDFLNSIYEGVNRGNIRKNEWEKAMKALGASVTKTVEVKNVGSNILVTKNSNTIIGKAEMDVIIKDARSTKNSSIRSIGLDTKLTTHYSAYYFYIPEWKREADYDTTKIASYYSGMSISDIGTAETSNMDEFVYNWNAMGYESNSGNIKAVVINTHSNEKGLVNDQGNYIVLASDMYKLDNKNVDNLILYGCNAGHLDHIGDNPASQFLYKVNGGKVLASDGTVSKGPKYKSKYTSSFREKRIAGSKRKNKGWIIYTDSSGNIATSKSLGKKLRIEEMLKKLK